MRLFVALDLPGAVKDHLDVVRTSAEVWIPDARWVPRANLHVTLSFLGEVAEDRVAEVSTTLSHAVADLVDFPAHLTHLGAFPSWRRARIVWAGLEDQSGGLSVLADAVLGALVAIGFPRDERPFSAHATLARLRVPARVDPPPVELDPAPFPVDRLTLFRSRLGRPAPTYEALATFPFRREPSAPVGDE